MPDGHAVLPDSEANHRTIVTQVPRRESQCLRLRAESELDHLSIGLQFRHILQRQTVGLHGSQRHRAIRRRLCHVLKQQAIHANGDEEDLLIQS
eukprot:CAMPEP_0170638884 /NCGR_PEP_ID=MMETSP0224-20130122/39319_1 /TAXON_ID=285029 /ORGANISM="Togula jolla, Strain CCCM 725" /LENGTH=93 /DNA_ID=CAMNT_0010969133 /DNA_START=107 /DNA_END=384 /DNA_ORIENTATION=+